MTLTTTHYLAELHGGRLNTYTYLDSEVKQYLLLLTLTHQFNPNAGEGQDPWWPLADEDRVEVELPMSLADTMTDLTFSRLHALGWNAQWDNAVFAKQGKTPMMLEVYKITKGQYGGLFPKVQNPEWQSKTKSADIDDDEKSALLRAYQFHANRKDGREPASTTPPPKPAPAPAPLMPPTTDGASTPPLEQPETQPDPTQATQPQEPASPTSPAEPPQPDPDPVPTPPQPDPAPETPPPPAPAPIPGPVTAEPQAPAAPSGEQPAPQAPTGFLAEPTLPPASPTVPLTPATPPPGPSSPSPETQAAADADEMPF